MGYTGLWVFKSEAAKVAVAPLYQQRATEPRLLLLLKLKSCFYQNYCDFKFVLVGLGKNYGPFNKTTFYLIYTGVAFTLLFGYRGF